MIFDAKSQSFKILVAVCGLVGATFAMDRIQTIRIRKILYHQSKIGWLEFAGLVAAKCCE